MKMWKHNYVNIYIYIYIYIYNMCIYIYIYIYIYICVCVCFVIIITLVCVHRIMLFILRPTCIRTYSLGIFLIPACIREWLGNIKCYHFCNTDLRILLLLYRYRGIVTFTAPLRDLAPLPLATSRALGLLTHLNERIWCKVSMVPRRILLEWKTLA